MPRSSARRIAGVILAAAMALPLMVPGLALAGSGHDPAPGAPFAQYDTRAEGLGQQPETGESGYGAIDDRLVGSLPFTGLDVAILLAAAMSLAGIAITLRLLSRPRRPVQGLSPGAAPTPTRVLAVAKVQRSGSPSHARVHSGS
jgi:hypothetical protein